MRLEDMETGDLPLFTYDEIKTIPVEAIMRLFELKGLEKPLKPGSTRTVELVHMLYTPEWDEDYEVESSLITYFPRGGGVMGDDCLINVEDITDTCGNTGRWKLSIGKDVSSLDDPTIIVHVRIVKPLSDKILREFGLFYRPRIKS